MQSQHKQTDQLIKKLEDKLQGKTSKRKVFSEEKVSAKRQRTEERQTDSTKSPEFSEEVKFMFRWMDMASRRRFDCQMRYYKLVTTGRQTGYSISILTEMEQLNAEMNALDLAAGGCLRKLTQLKEAKM